MDTATGQWGMERLGLGRSGAARLRGFLFLALILGVSACGSESTPPDPGPEYVLPSTPDDLIQTYRRAYTRLQLSTIDSLLAPGFLFEFAAIDVDSFQIEPTWGRDEELASVHRFFTGEEGRWPTGETRSPLDLEFPLNPALFPVEGSEWTEGSEPGRFERTYSVSMLITYIEGIDVVSGTHTFEVIDMSAIGGPEGQSASGFALLSWRDSGISTPMGRGTEPGPPVEGARVVGPVGPASLHNASWGYVKASFREIE